MGETLSMLVDPHVPTISQSHSMRMKGMRVKSMHVSATAVNHKNTKLRGVADPNLSDGIAKSDILAKM